MVINTCFHHTRNTPLLMTLLESCCSIASASALQPLPHYVLGYYDQTKLLLLAGAILLPRAYDAKARTLYYAGKEASSSKSSLLFMPAVC